MKLPNADQAVVELDKLIEYCLNREHWRGRHKARVFASALGITSENSEELRDAILNAVGQHEAEPGLTDGFGSRYTLDFPLQGSERQATVRTIWIIRTAEDFPRLVSCYVCD